MTKQRIGSLAHARDLSILRHHYHDELGRSLAIAFPRAIRGAKGACQRSDVGFVGGQAVSQGIRPGDGMGAQHQTDLVRDWELARQQAPLQEIQPLE
jgi:hypothetical protein